MRSLIAIIGKDLRLMVRDRAGLLFVAVAPIIVISVAGFSLAGLYGADPTGQSGYELPIADEDGGTLADQIEAQLAGDTNVRARRVGSRTEAEQLVRDKLAGSALVIPAGTEAAIAAGRPARILLFTDPVKYLERLNVRLRVLEVRDRLASDEHARTLELLGEQRRRLDEQLDSLTAALARIRNEGEALNREIEGDRTRLAEELDAEIARVRTNVRRQIDEQVMAVVARLNETVAQRLGELRDPAQSFLDALAESRSDFETWFAELEQLAGRRAEDIPPPPAFPEPPTELVRALEDAPAPIEIPVELEIGIELPRPAVPELPSLIAPDLEVPTIVMPEPLPPSTELGVEELTVDNNPTTVNAFDQNVPGFSVTFLLLGMLLGISLGVLDERDWGTFDRMRSLPIPARNILIGKLAARFAVGVVQMVVLFAVGYFLFDISLGPQPWALLLPISGIAFAGTAFGLIVAAAARSRDAALPLGSIVIVTMAAVGGCWWPIDLEPQWMRTIALAFPTTWAMEAFNDLMIRLRRADAVYAATAVLVAYGLGYLLIGLWLFRRRTAKS